MRSTSKSCIWLVVLTLLALGSSGMAMAVNVLPVHLPVLRDALPGLTVQLPGQSEQSFTVAELEALGTWRVRTTSPWDDGQIVLEGPLLRDVLAHVGLDRVQRVIVRSADAYAQEIPQADWRDFPVILATRSGGKPLGQRSKGPTRIVYPLLDHPELASAAHRARWVWLITSIEVPG